MALTARRAFVATLVIGGTVVLALALWKLRVILALLFLGFIVAAAMRPGIERLRAGGVPRGIGILLHYAVLVALIGGLLWAVVPRALDQVQTSIGDLPETRSDIREEANRSSGLKARVLRGVEQRLEQLPKPEELVDEGAEAGRLAIEISLGLFFVLAVGAYWIFERKRAEALVCRFLPKPHAKTVRDTWELIDLKLGAYVRGQGLLVVLVATVLSLVFWAIGLPFWLLIGVFAGFVEIVPVIGPMLAGALAVGVGLTVSWQVAVGAGIAVLVVRLFEDYIVIPRVLGHAVGLTPLTVLVAVAAVTILFGGFAVLLAIPLAAVIATLIDVTVLGKHPSDEDVPTVLFPAKEAEE